MKRSEAPPLRPTLDGLAQWLTTQTPATHGRFQLTSFLNLHPLRFRLFAQDRLQGFVEGLLAGRLFLFRAHFLNKECPLTGQLRHFFLNILPFDRFFLEAESRLFGFQFP
jgi:hypothetical protein